MVLITLYINPGISLCVSSFLNIDPEKLYLVLVRIELVELLTPFQAFMSLGISLHPPI